MINWKFIEHISNQNYCLCCVVHSTLGYSSQQDYTILNSKPEISIPEMSTVLIQIALRWGILVRAQVAILDFHWLGFSFIHIWCAFGLGWGNYDWRSQVSPLVHIVRFQQSLPKDWHHSNENSESAIVSRHIQTGSIGLIMRSMKDSFHRFNIPFLHLKHISSIQDRDRTPLHNIGNLGQVVCYLVLESSKEANLPSFQIGVERFG